MLIMFRSRNDAEFHIVPGMQNNFNIAHSNIRIIYDYIHNNGVLHLSH
jgi:hypothetical protein